MVMIVIVIVMVIVMVVIVVVVMMMKYGHWWCCVREIMEMCCWNGTLAAKPFKEASMIIQKQLKSVEALIDP